MVDRATDLSAESEIPQLSTIRHQPLQIGRPGRNCTTNSQEKRCYTRRGTTLDVSKSRGVAGARKAPVALSAVGGYSQKPQPDEMEFADHHCRRPERRVIHG